MISEFVILNAAFKVDRPNLSKSNDLVPDNGVEKVIDVT